MLRDGSYLDICYEYRMPANASVFFDSALKVGTSVWLGHGIIGKSFQTPLKE